ncbi:MAG: hypothetical protein KDK11_16675 [Maritimibacter sp.]|nr:hypothetical protein [Maritimibacter sp.]
MARNKPSIATRLALALAGAGLAVAGTVLLLRAAWVGLSLALGALWATVILGGALALIGALLLALAARVPRRRAATDDDLIVRIVTAFFGGLAAGQSSRDR